MTVHKASTTKSECVSAIKSVKQHYEPDGRILKMLDIFRQMVNECIRIGLENDTSNMKKLSQLAHKQLAKYDMLNYYKLCNLQSSRNFVC